MGEGDLLDRILWLFLVFLTMSGLLVQVVSIVHVVVHNFVWGNLENFVFYVHVESEFYIVGECSCCIVQVAQVHF
jgi:hypothetical protein